MSLSVWCVTADPPHRVATMLSRLRPIADEIIVAVDVKVDPAELGPFDYVADRILRVEVQPPVERVLPWLHRQCSGDWTLRLDGDEVPSPAFIRALPELIDATDVVQYFVSRRWLYPDLSHWLDEWPWASDYQNRLLRRDPALWFPGLSQTCAAEDFPARYLELPIYHLVNALVDHTERVDKVRYYEGIDEPLRDVRGDALLGKFYLPEEYARFDPAPLPDEDAKAVQEVADAPRGTARRSRSDLQVVPSLEIDHFWPAHQIKETAYRAHIEPLFVERSMPANETHSFLRLLVHNLGDECWPGGDRSPLIRLAYRWLSSDGSLLIDEGYRSPFQAPVPPGASCIVPAVVTTPAVPGEYVLEFDVVHEFVRWFGCSTRAKITIDPPDRLPRWKMPDEIPSVMQNHET